MSIIAWFIFGLGTGWFGNILMSSGFGGLVSDLVLGVFGAIVGGFFMIFVMDSKNILASQLFRRPRRLRAP